MLDTGLLCIAFIMPRSVPSILHGFSQGKLLDLIKSLFCICWNKHVTSILESTYSVYCIYWFDYADLSLSLCNEVNLINMNNLLMCFWIQYANTLLRILHLYSSGKLDHNFLCSSVSVWFWIRVIVALFMYVSIKRSLVTFFPFLF